MPLFIRNIPFISIMLSMFAGIVTVPIRNGKVAYRICLIAEVIVLGLSITLLAYLARTDEIITFMMGHYPAPWGNEIRASKVEAVMAVLFSAVMLFSVLGGKRDLFSDILPKKQSLYFITYDELFGAMIALIYTNDIFTAYVFIEISMLAASAIIMAKDSGRSLIATLRYLIMMLLGSGFFLLGIIILYCITGHLLLPSLGDAISSISAGGAYSKPLLCVIALVCVGLAIKSAVFPFHTMLPGAHSVATTTSSAVLSGLVLKAYIFLLIKLICRVFTVDLIVGSGFSTVALVFGCVGTIACSAIALRESDMKRMIAYSSSAQIGYIFIGIGLAGMGGLAAALLHVVVHALTKSLMFVCAGNMAGACGHKTDIHELRGAAYLNKPAAIGFTAAALSMIGIPFFPGFASKFYLAYSAFGNTRLFAIVIITLLISMVLNAMYFVPAIIAIWSKNDAVKNSDYKVEKSFTALIALALVVVLALGVYFKPLYDLFVSGLELM